MAVPPTAEVVSSPKEAPVAAKLNGCSGRTECRDIRVAELPTRGTIAQGESTPARHGDQIWTRWLGYPGMAEVVKNDRTPLVIVVVPYVFVPARRKFDVRTVLNDIGDVLVILELTTAAPAANADIGHRAHIGNRAGAKIECPWC